MLLSRRMNQESEVPGLAPLPDLDLRQLFSTLVVTSVPQVESRSDCAELAMQAVRRVASLNSETSAAIP
jgi:hypothetical protein